jgi:hypothetical protein
MHDCLHQSFLLSSQESFEKWNEKRTCSYWCCIGHQYTLQHPKQGHVHTGAVLDINTHCNTPNKSLLAHMEAVTFMKLPTIKHRPMPVFPKTFLFEDPFWSRKLNTDRPCSRQYSVWMGHPKLKIYISELILYTNIYTNTYPSAFLQLITLFLR